MVGAPGMLLSPPIYSTTLTTFKLCVRFRSSLPNYKIHFRFLEIWGCKYPTTYVTDSYSTYSHLGTQIRSVFACADHKAICGSEYCI